MSVKGIFESACNVPVEFLYHGLAYLDHLKVTESALIAVNFLGHLNIAFIRLTSNVFTVAVRPDRA